MWRDEEISETDLESQDVEMDNTDEQLIEVEESDSDFVVEANDVTNQISTNPSSNIASRLRERISINYANEQVNLDEDVYSTDSSTDSNLSSDNTGNTFSASDIVGEPRLITLNEERQQSANLQDLLNSNTEPLNVTITNPELINVNNEGVEQLISVNNLLNSNQNPRIDENMNNDEINNQINNVNNDKNNENEDEQKPNQHNDSAEILDTCLICCEPFTSTSEHRIVSLKCGHIYGKECIERWLKTKESKRRCPKCNQVSNKNDIRVIYAKSILAVDTTDLDKAKKELENERKLRIIYERQVEELKFDLGLKESENIHLKREISTKEELIKRFKSSNSNQVESNLNQAKINSLNKQPFTHLKTIDLKIDGCRMIVVNELLGFLVISQPTSPNAIVKGFGIRRIALNNLNSFEFIFLHTALIKDMELHPVDALVLTASFDKQVKLVNLITKQIMASFTFEVKPWCVSWNKKVSTLFYVGLNNGYLYECSTLTNSIIQKINTCLSVPIKLILHLNHDQQTNRVHLLITSIKTSFFCEIKSNHESSNSNDETVNMMKPLPISGPIISTNIIGDHNSGNILLTVRPSNKYQHNIQHYVLDFTISDNNDIQYNLLNTYLGGYQSKHLINSKIFAHPDKLDSFIVCSGDEDTNGALVWEKDNENPIQKFNFKNVAFDVALFKPNQSSEPMLTFLTEKSLHLYKWSS